jgi:hypothetical protein
MVDVPLRDTCFILVSWANRKPISLIIVEMGVCSTTPRLPEPAKRRQIEPSNAKSLSLAHWSPVKRQLAAPAILREILNTFYYSSRTTSAGKTPRVRSIRSDGISDLVQLALYRRIRMPICCCMKLGEHLHSIISLVPV